MARSHVYDDSPGSANIPLDEQDLDTLLAGDARLFAQDTRRVRHLLTRTRAAFAAHRDQVRSFQRDIEALREASRRSGTPVTAALDALRNLTVDEQRQVFDRHASRFLEDVDRARAAAERGRVAATNEVNRARFALGKVLSDTTISPDVRQSVRDALAMLDAGAGLAAPPVPPPEPTGGFSVPARDEQALGDALFGHSAPGATASPSAGGDGLADLFGDDMG